MSRASRRPAVFLDRDGVVNEVEVRDGVVAGPTHVAELRIVAGARDALEQLAAAGFVLVVVTNQPDVARGRAREGDVVAIHDALRAALPLDDVLWCPHDGREGCSCRKPRPGMLVTADVNDRFTLAAEFGTRNIGIAVAIAVTFLGRVEFAHFAVAYALVEVPLLLVAALLFRRQRQAVLRGAGPSATLA